MEKKILWAYCVLGYFRGTKVCSLEIKPITKYHQQIFPAFDRQIKPILAHQLGSAVSVMDPCSFGLCELPVQYRRRSQGSIVLMMMIVVQTTIMLGQCTVVNS